MAIETRSINVDRVDSGPYVARIISHLDPTYMGTLQVELLRDVGNLQSRTGNVFQVKYLSPFYGVTSYDYTTKNPDYNGTQKSYGFWMIPPDVGTLVMVIFVEGDPRRGYWFGCVQDEYMNFMVPGLAATEANPDGKKKPVAEYNKRTFDGSAFDPTQFKKPVHPLAEILQKQGLLEDETRGITTSSARREVPSAVFGISTPGPVDKRSGAPKGPVGKHESLIDSAFISRLGGTTLVMDDGDDKFLRKTPASLGPPEYASVENEEKGGQPDIPHNELFRIRTRTGHQILLHNSEDLIYIGNAKGTAWIELTSNGKIDIYAADSISIHTGNDLNITADRDINFNAGRNINFTAGNDHKLKVGNNYDIVVGSDGKLKVGGSYNINTTGDNKFTTAATTHIKSGAGHKETAPRIDMNGPPASSAAEAVDALLPGRVPTAEPWGGHENLNPAAHVPDKTQAGGSGASATHPKILDTFKKIGK